MEPMAKFAEHTKVPVEQTRGEIQATLKRFGADQFSFAQDEQQGLACIMFRSHKRLVRFTIKTASDFERRGQGPSKLAALDRNDRQKWRALLLSIKAKLSAIESGIAEFEDEFLANVVVPGDTTAGQWLRPQLAVAYETGKMPTELLALPAPSKP
jgi:hypothetical protein